MDLTLRDGPGLDRRPLKTLEKGASVQILESENGWLKVSYDGQTGYILGQSEFILIVPPSQPDDSNGPSLEPAGSQASRGRPGILQELEQANTQMQSFVRTESAILNELSDCDLSLNSTRRQVLDMEMELAQLQGHITEKKLALEQAQRQIRASESRAAQRVVALYKLCWLGHLPVLASAESSADFFNRKSNLEKILAYDQRLLLTLANEKQTQAHLLDGLNADLAVKSAADAKLKDELTRLTQEREKKALLLADIQSQKALKMAFVESLEQSARALNQAILSLASPQTIRDSKQPPLAKPFSSRKGLLNSPVKGKIVSFFGAYKSNGLDVPNNHSGITIQADRGEPIRSVAEGTTLYADWFKGYGNMIIIDHGDHYYTVYAHLEEFFKEKGSRVESDEVIATVGDTEAMSGPGLHFEVRHHDQPLDPMEWLDNIKRSHLHD
jgi:septal ring factor EnvC (AmiA/AmiB activator)